MSVQSPFARKGPKPAEPAPTPASAPEEKPAPVEAKDQALAVVFGVVPHLVHGKTEYRVVQCELPVHLLEQGMVLRDAGPYEALAYEYLDGEPTRYYVELKNKQARR